MTKVVTGLLGALAIFSVKGQEVKEYRSAYEVYEQAVKYSNDDLDEYAYDEYMSINENDTAYFEAQYYAISTAADLNRYDTVIKNAKRF